MDELSQLLSLGRSHVELDVRCLLDGPFAMPHDPLPSGEAAFHLVLAGTCRLRTADGRTLQLADGDFVLLPAGAHDLLDAGRPVAAGCAARTGRRRRRGAAGQVESRSGRTGRRERGSAVRAVCLCGGAGEPLMRTLPHVLHVGLREASGFAPLQLLTSVLRTEASNGQPGAGAIVNALGQAAARVRPARIRAGARVPSGWLALAADARLGPSVHTSCRRRRNLDGRVARRRLRDVARDVRTAFPRAGRDERRRVRRADPDDARARCCRTRSAGRRKLARRSATSPRPPSARRFARC